MSETVVKVSVRARARQAYEQAEAARQQSERLAAEARARACAYRLANILDVDVSALTWIELSSNDMTGGPWDAVLRVDGLEFIGQAKEKGGEYDVTVCLLPSHDQMRDVDRQLGIDPSPVYSLGLRIKCASAPINTLEDLGFQLSSFEPSYL